MGSNLVFKSNVHFIKSTSTSKGDDDFLHRITDFYALKKLYEGPCGRCTNSSYYMFKHSQSLELFPYGNFFALRRSDETIEQKNREMNELYGYSQRSYEKLFPILGELHLNYGDSIWKTDEIQWWLTKGFFGKNEGESIGHWVQAGTQLGTVIPSGGGELFTTYIKEEIRRAQVAKGTYVPVKVT